MKRLFQNESGQALIELALFVSVFILLLAGIADYAYYIREQMVLNEAVAAGAQYGITYGKEKDFVGMQNVARLAGYDIQGMVVPLPTLVYTCTPGGTPVSSATLCSGYGTPITYVQVTASATVPAALKWSGISNSLDLTATATYRVPWTK